VSVAEGPRDVPQSAAEDHGTGVRSVDEGTRPASGWSAPGGDLAHGRSRDDRRECRDRWAFRGLRHGSPPASTTWTSNCAGSYHGRRVNRRYSPLRSAGSPMRRRGILAGLTALTGASGVTALLPSDDDSDESPPDATTNRERPVRIRVTNALSSDARATITVKSGDESFLTARITSTPDEEQAISIPVPPLREYELDVEVEAELDSPSEVALGRDTVRASGASLSTADSHGFTHSDETALRVTIGNPFLEIEPVEE